jgi:plasmid stabilization system protein ParE
VKYRISISAEVASQILSASSYYEGIREGLGIELEQQIQATLDSITVNPNLFPTEFGPVHRALISRFKKIIFYTVRGDSVVVVELRDARQEPPDWKERGFLDN